ncbi:MAG: response regulator [Betaproteobacteria bacterium]|nr:response regulator [Betaproteobacteria bacterium]
MNINPLDVSTSATLNFAGKNVLIIDDFMEMRNVLRDILYNCGAEIKKMQMAANGNEAVSWMKKVKYNIVLCDLNLGNGKNGQQVLEEAKHQSLIDPSCLWIMITAEKTMEAVAGTAEYQPDTYLLKPITEANLRARLTKIWGKKEIFAEIHKAMKQRDYSKALSLCDQRMVSNKIYAADLIRTKCDLLLMMGEYDRAQGILGKILDARDLPWAKAALAKISLKKNDLAAAKSILEETAEANPAYLEAQDLLAHTLQVMGDLEGAGNVLERSLKFSPNSAIRQKNLGTVSMKLGKLDDAERAFRKSVSLAENSVLRTADAYLGLAKVCSANKNPEQALKTLEQLNKNFAADDVRVKALAVEGMVHHQCGNEQKAKEIAEKIGQSIATGSVRPDNESALEIARLLITAGDKGQAIKLLQDEIKRNPESANLLHDVAEIFDGAGMSEEGSQLIETSRQEAMLIMNQGVMLISKGQYEEALSAMRGAYTAMPSNIRVLLNLAYVIITYMQKNGTTPELIGEARRSLQTANELSPGEPRFIRLTAALNELATK